MVKSFSNRGDFLAAVAEAVSENDNRPETREAILEGVGRADDALAQWQEQDNPGQEFRMGRWFIRNDDLPFLQLIGAIASVFIAISATGGVAAAAFVGPISNFAAACWQLKRKGTTLSREQVAVLGVLHAIRGGTVDQVVAKLVPAGYPLEKQEVEGALFSMASLELYDGSVVAIVRQDPDKKWRALHV